MNSLYNEYECYTEEANDLAKEIHNAIYPIVKKYCKMGYSTREIESIVITEAQMVTICARLDRQQRKVKEKRENAKSNL